MKKVMFAGTFDPFTKGHFSVVESAVAAGFEVVVAICEKSKSGVSAYDRVEIAKTSVRSLNNVSVVSFDGLLTDFMKKNQVNILVRGLRNTVDFEYEKGLHGLYKDMYPEIEIFYLFASKAEECISSSSVREILSYGGNAGAYIIEASYPIVEKLYKK